MAFNITRMTAYALISSLEEDLRGLVKEYIIDESSINKELRERAKIRIEKDIGGIFEDIELRELIDYFDLGDTFQTINSNKEIFPDNVIKTIKHFTRELETLVSVRNRVMHIRPLNFDDLPNVTNFCESLIDFDTNISWQSISDTLNKIKRNPSFVLSLNITNLDDDNVINHNLPMPDFDETGLIGRDQEIEQIKKLCYGSFPVISIVGEGGVGKSALALKVAYELIEDKKSFDAVVWVTSKTTQITLHEIREIKGAINTSLGVIQEIGAQVMGDNSKDYAYTFDEVIEYLATFKIALFIDNLETIMDENIKRFVGSLPPGSKIIITSRIGLGAYEYPIKLQGIEEKYASQLLRMVAKIRSVNAISTLPEKKLRDYVNRMHRNPSYIKWFVSSVNTGMSIETVLQNSGSFLDFCMSNVYQYLSKDAQQITTSMQCASGHMGLPELAYLNDFDSIRVQEAILELMSTNMLSQRSDAKNSSVKTMYQLSELARSYLSKHHKPSNTFQKKIRDKRNKLNSLFERQMNQNTSDKYAPFNIQFREKSDRVIVKELQTIYGLINNSVYDEAINRLDEAHRLAPDYFEVARFKAYLFQKIGNTSDAREQYELAILLSPETPQLHYWFGKFLQVSEENINEAVDNFEKAYELDPKSHLVSVTLARGYLFQNDFEKAQKILNLLEDSISQADDFIHKTYYDSKVQLNYRRADALFQRSNYKESLSYLEKMADVFNAIPTNFKDRYIRKKLKKCKYITSRLSNELQGNELVRLEAFIRWVKREIQKM